MDVVNQVRLLWGKSYISLLFCSVHDATFILHNFPLCAQNYDFFWGYQSTDLNAFFYFLCSAFDYLGVEIVIHASIKNCSDVKATTQRDAIRTFFSHH